MISKMFRGKIEKSSEWVYWNIFGELTDITGNKNTYGAFSFVDTIKHKIDFSTITESIGAKDINGCEIFDGDIARMRLTEFDCDETIVKVLWDRSRCSFVLKQGDFPPDDVIPGLFETDNLEVIGNVFCSES